MAELKESWWSKNKAKTLGSTGLGKILKQYEAALVDLEKEAKNDKPKAASLEPFVKVEELLTKTLPAAVEAALRKCNKTLHKETIAILEEYKKTLIPKASPKVQALGTTIDRKLEARRKEMAETCQAIYELGGTKLTETREFLRQASQLVAGSDALQMEIIEALSGGDKAKADSLVQKTGKNAVEVANLVKLASMNLEKGKTERKAKWNYEPGLFPPGKDNYTRMGDKVSGLFDAADMELDKIKPLVKEAQEAVQEAEKLIKGAADTSKIYLKSAERAAKLAVSAADRLSGAARENGGSVDKLDFDYMNVKDSKDKAEVASEIKRIAGGMAAIGKQSASLKTASETAVKDIEKSLAGFPEFVREDHDAFGKYFDEMRKAQHDLETTAEAATKSTARLTKLGQKLKDLAATLKG